MMGKKKLIFNIVLCILCFCLIFLISACNKDEKTLLPKEVIGSVSEVVIDNGAKTISLSVENEVSSFNVEQIKFDTDLAISFSVFSDQSLSEETAIENPVSLREGTNVFYVRVSAEDKEPVVISVTINRAIAAHRHTFAKEWTHDTDSHWHGATCEHTTEIADKASHVWDEGTITSAPTETETGIKEYLCTVCNAEKTETIAMLPHTHKYTAEWSGDETSHWHSATCGHDNLVSGYSSHIWNSGVVTISATESTEGERVFTCIICNRTKTETIERLAHTHTYSAEWTFDKFYHWHTATCAHTELVAEKSAHSWDEGLITVEPTEEAEGERSYLCTVCGQTKTAVVPKLEHVHTFESDWSYDGIYHWRAATCTHTTVVKDKAEHAWGNGTVITEATEDEQGLMSFICSVCGQTKQVVIPKAEHVHKFAAVWSKDANFHWHTATCAHSNEVGDKAAHIWDNGVVTEQPTEQTEGTKLYSCIVCGQEKQVTMDKLPHTHKFDMQSWTSDETYHWHAATCEHTTLTSDKNSHDWDEGVVTVEATELIEGQKEQTCLVCGKTRTVSIGFAEHVHTYDTSKWTSDDYFHWHASTCGHSSEVIDSAAHTWDGGTVSVTATEEIEGEIVYVCTVCGKEKTETVPCLPHTHTYNMDEWTSDAVYHWHAASCKHTSETSNKAEHSWNEGKITKQPTMYEEGETTYTCIVCAHNKAEPIPVLESYKLSFGYFSDSGELTITNSTRIPLDTDAHTRAIERENYRFTGWDIPFDAIEVEGEIDYVLSAEAIEEAADDKKELIVIGRFVRLYTVTFNYVDVIEDEVTGEESEVSESIIIENVEENTTVDAPFPPERADYRFYSWDYETHVITYTEEYEIEGETGSVVITKTVTAEITGDIEINAIYIRLYNVEFCDFDGSPLTSETVDEGEEIIPPETNRSKHKFIGWKKQGEQDVLDEDYFNSVEGNGVYVAVYVPLYEVKFVYYLNNEIKTDVKQLEDGTPIELPNDFSETGRVGYTFVGWDKETSGLSVSAEDITITAQYSIKYFDVDFFMPNGTSIPYRNLISGGDEPIYEEIDYKVAYGYSASEPLYPDHYFVWDDTRAYAFSSWTVNNVTVDISRYEITEDTVFVAVYEDPYYTPGIAVSFTKEDNKNVAYVSVCTYDGYPIYAIDVSFSFVNAVLSGDGMGDFKPSGGNGHLEISNQQKSASFVWSSADGLILKETRASGEIYSPSRRILRLAVDETPVENYVFSSDTFNVASCTMIIGVPIKDENGGTEYVPCEITPYIEYRTI